MKDKHFHTSHLSVCGVDLSPFSPFPDPVSYIHCKLMGFQKEHDALSDFLCFIFFSQSFDHNHCPTPSHPFYPATWTKGHPLLWREGAQLPGCASPCCRANWQLVCFPLSFTVLSKAWFCELTFDRHLLYLTCQLQRTSSFTACGLRAQTNPSSQEEPHRAHGSAPRLSPAHPVLSDAFSCVRTFRRVWVSARLCGVILGQIKNGNHSCCEANTVKKWNFCFSIVRKSSCYKGNCSQGSEPTSPTSVFSFHREQEMVTINRVRAEKAAFLVHVLQNLMASMHYQYDEKFAYPASETLRKQDHSVCSTFKLIFSKTKQNTNLKCVEFYSRFRNKTLSKPFLNLTVFLSLLETAWAGLGWVGDLG